MYNLNWSRKNLRHKNWEHFVSIMPKCPWPYGLNIFTSEVYDHGIDFAQKPKGFLKFQVKSIRKSSKYVFMRKDYFDISDKSLYLMLFLPNDGEHPCDICFPATGVE